MTDDVIHEATDDNEHEGLRVKKPQDSWRARQTYDGADLKPYDGRPGALDFLSKPSRGLS